MSFSFFFFEVSVWFLDTIPEYFKYELCDKDMKYVLSELYQSSKIEFLSTKPVIKTGYIEFPTPWHQDCLYWHGKHVIIISIQKKVVCTRGVNLAAQARPSLENFLKACPGPLAKFFLGPAQPRPQNFSEAQFGPDILKNT